MSDSGDWSEYTDLGRIYPKKTKTTPFYICIEGIDGVGKTTQVDRIIEYLEKKKKRVLKTKEPGSSHLPLTLHLRSLMLDNKYKDEMTANAREYISQAIRSIHIEKLIIPSINNNKYDFIVQDRGLLSGIAYGIACGIKEEDVLSFASITNTGPKYDVIIILEGNIQECVNRAKSCKKEFVDGDVIEDKGSSFMENVSKLLAEHASKFSDHIITIKTSGESIESITEQIIDELNLA
jgi:dTMP kinase